MDYTDYFWQGEKVRLRPVCIDDVDNWFEGSLDSPCRRLLQLGIELPQSRDGLVKIVEKYAECHDVDGVIIFTIEDLCGNNVGGISYHSRNRKNGTFAMGLSIAEAHRRSGFAADAARILMRYAFHERRYQKCNSACVEGNEASVALHRSLGFQKEGRRRRVFYLDGRFYDDLLFGITREEFDETQG